MIEKESNRITAEFDKLSIQASLNGLSFCVLDTVQNRIRYSDSISFEKERSPYGLQKGLVSLIEKHSLHKKVFADVIVVHRNNLFSLVPKSLFVPADLANYLKFNSKILATDHTAYDEMDSLDMVNVYIPFININNHIYDLYGEFTYKHNGTVLLETLLKEKISDTKPVCYVHTTQGQMDLAIILQKKLLFYNSFKYNTKEDFIYYLLFTLEQLKLDAETTSLRLFGSIEEDDEIYRICYEHIKHVGIYASDESSYPFMDGGKEAIDFTVLNSL
jgi:hypothetical protein